MALKIADDHLLFFNGVPFVESIFERGIEAVALGDYAMHRGHWLQRRSPLMAG